MKRILFIAILFISYTVAAQDEEGEPAQPAGPWKIDFSAGVALNQAAFSPNWTGGGVNTFGLNGYTLFRANFKNGRHNWDNTVDLLYGFINASNTGYRKNQDLISIDTKYGYEFARNWQAFGSVTFQSQFAEGFRYENDSLGVEQELLISDWLAPAFITFAVGAEYKPNDKFFIRLSPLSPRITIVRRDDIIFNVPGNYGVEPGETTRFENFAGTILTEYEKDLAANLNMKLRYRLFANYETFSWKEIDHRFGVIFTTNVVKLIDVSFNAIVLYDFDQDIGVQWSQGLGVTLSYKFKNFTEEE